MDFKERYIQYVQQQRLFNATDELLLAVSGGVDSVVLCELCQQAGYQFSIVHCNFKLRGEESDRDEKFVKELGEKYGVEVKVKRFDTEQYANEKRLSIQEAARNLRYQWFEELINQPTDQPINHLLTAHHADDNIETLLMHFFRGTGLHGLTGIPMKNDFIRRPLLSFSKEELLAFAKEHQLEYVEDSSNESSKYTRNFFRNELLPAISKVYPQVKQNLQDNIDRFTEIEKLYQLTTSQLLSKLCRSKENEIHVPVKQLMGYNNRALIYALISKYGFSEKQVDEIEKLSQSDTGKYITSPDDQYRIIKHRHWFIISRTNTQLSQNIIIEVNDKKIDFEEGTLKFETTLNQQPQTSSQVACLDKKNIQYPLLLRKWKTGDYFYPLGMRKKKKLARFFIDNKLSKTEKENAWVLEADKRIIRVIGQRIDDRFKLTDQTKEILEVSFMAK
ncbi:MAG TPA: tRNA lysidine(34) synthetase TilS [Chitinophagaceae bacterium]|nr:tRNA lysidine(34) synthetase TilS [Chitinophagaceae bacterium]